LFTSSTIYQKTKLIKPGARRLIDYTLFYFKSDLNNNWKLGCGKDGLEWWVSEVEVGGG